MYEMTYKGPIIGNNQRYISKYNKALSPQYQGFKEVVGWEWRVQNKGIRLFFEELFIELKVNTRLDTDN